MSDILNTTKIPDLSLHDLCKIMPAHTEAEYAELKEDIQKNKPQLPIITYEGRILDGRGRYNACVELAKEGVETGFRTDPYTGPDPRRYVISANVKRRHLQESQRALIAAQLASFKHGGDRSKTSIDVLTRKDAAHLLNVSPSSVERASNVLKNGVPALVEAVKGGQLKVSAVEEFAKSDLQDKLIAQCNGDVVKAVGKFEEEERRRRAEEERKKKEAQQATKSEKQSPSETKSDEDEDDDLASRVTPIAADELFPLLKDWDVDELRKLHALIGERIATLGKQSEKQPPASQIGAGSGAATGTASTLRRPLA